MSEWFTLETPSLTVVLGAFLVAATVIGVAGIRLARLADQLADRTGLGEAVVGGLLLGMSTSLSGTVTSVSAAVDGYASLSVSNAIGGIAVQTVFLVIADMAYRKVNLEHAAADEKNMFQAALLVLMLGLPLAAYLMPSVTIWSVHPVTLALPAAYILGARATIVLQRKPMWQPRSTAETQEDVPSTRAMTLSLRSLIVRFLALACVLSIAGFVMAKSGETISNRFGISQTVVGALMTATATSLPELVTTLAAVRQGALQLAVGGIVGGNTFDVLFLSLSDVAYKPGSLYHAMDDRDALLITGSLLITAILLMGLIMRDRRGIGFEGFSILLIYAAIVAVQIMMG